MNGGETGFLLVEQSTNDIRFSSITEGQHAHELFCESLPEKLEDFGENVFLIDSESRETRLSDEANRMKHFDLLLKKKKLFSERFSSQIDSPCISKVGGINYEQGWGVFVGLYAVESDIRGLTMCLTFPCNLIDQFKPKGVRLLYSKHKEDNSIM